MEDMIFPIGNDYELYTGGCAGADEEAEAMGMEMVSKCTSKLGRSKLAVECPGLFSLVNSLDIFLLVFHKYFVYGKGT